MPFDEQPFLHRSFIMGEILSKNSNVLRFVSQYNHKLHKIRKEKGLIKFTKRHSLYYIPAFISYKHNKLLRLISYYLNAVNLFFSLIKFRSLKPEILIVSVPPPINLFVAVLYKKIFSKASKVICDYRDLWPMILTLENKSISSITIAKLMDFELRYSLKQVEAVIGVSEYFSKHLQSYYKHSIPSTVFYNVKPSDNKRDFGVLKQYEFLEYSNNSKDILLFGGTLNLPTVNLLLNLIHDPFVSSNFIVVICGDGYYADKISCITESHLFYLSHIGYEEFSYLKTLASYGVVCVEPRIDYQNSITNKFFDFCSSSTPMISNCSGLMAEMITKHDLGFVYSSKSNFNCFALKGSHKYHKIKESIKLFNENICSFSKNEERLKSFLTNL